MKLTYKDVTVAEINSAADLNESLLNKVYFVLFALSTDHYNLNGKHHVLFSMALEACNLKEDVHSLEALVGLSNNADFIKLYFEHVIAGMTTLFKDQQVTIGTKMFMENVRAILNKDATPDAKRRKTASSAPKWSYLNVEFINLCYRVQMELTNNKIVECFIENVSFF